METIFDDSRGHRRFNGRTGGHGKASKSAGLARSQGSSGGDIILDNKARHQPCLLRHSGTLNESTNVGDKTGGSRVGGLNCASKANGNRRLGTRCFTQVWALSMEVKPYVLLD